jgi:putative ABC transport system permease protein
MEIMKLWLRWSGRDLRARWLQVAAIALIIALGTGVYAGMGANAPWRRISYDGSYALLHMYDLRVKLGESSVDGSRLLGALQNIPHKDWIKNAEVRFLAPTLVDASYEGKTILVPGQIVGVDVTDGGPHVNGIYIFNGRGLNGADDGQNTAVLEYHFAKYYGLPATGKIRLSGGIELDYVGQGVNPEYFMVMTENGGMMAESNFAAVFVPLETAQALTNNAGMANDLIITLNPGADQAKIQGEINQALSTAFPQVAASFMTPEDDAAYNELYGDIGGDQATYLIISYLFLAGAAFGVFNLASRLVEAQRREIGISMALGLSNLAIAIRPMLIALQIAILGLILGLGVGYPISQLFGHELQKLMPMPVFDTPFQFSPFARAAILGTVLPFLATLYPVWRALRVMPVDAIQTGYLVSKGGGLAPLVARIPLPGNSFWQMPIRNLLRAPRRSLMTLTGITVAITLLIAIMGMVDSLVDTIGKTKTELSQDHPDRLEVKLDFFYPEEWVENIRKLPQVAMAEPGIQVGGYLSHNGTRLETVIDLVDLDSSLWKPTLTAGSYPADTASVILSEKAARDLGVKPGDKITLTHPLRQGPLAFSLTNTDLLVAGTHALPLRGMTYIDIRHASLMGLGGQTNMVWVNPTPGADRGQVTRALFGQAGIASVQPVTGMVESLEEVMNLFFRLIYLVGLVVMLLAFLITFNSTSINVDERAREIATMFAFGLPIRTVTRMSMLENLIIGILGTLSGLGLGYVVLVWMMTQRMASQMRELDFSFILSPATLGWAVGIGVIVVALTPLLSMRKMLHMDIPSTLRVME